MTATAAPAPQADKKVVSPIGSPYAILKKDDSGLWDAIGSMSGRSAEHAIKKFAEHGNYATGTFIAIPAKQWKPLTLKAETVTTLKLEEAK